MSSEKFLGSQVSQLFSNVTQYCPAVQLHFLRLFAVSFQKDSFTLFSLFKLPCPFISPCPCSPHTRDSASHFIKVIKIINQDSLHLPASTSAAQHLHLSPCSASSWNYTPGCLFPIKGQSFLLPYVPSALASLAYSPSKLSPFLLYHWVLSLQGTISSCRHLQ